MFFPTIKIETHEQKKLYLVLVPYFIRTTTGVKWWVDSTSCNWLHRVLNIPHKSPHSYNNRIYIFKSEEICLLPHLQIRMVVMYQTSFRWKKDGIMKSKPRSVSTSRVLGSTFWMTIMCNYICLTHSTLQFYNILYDCISYIYRRLIN